MGSPFEWCRKLRSCPNLSMSEKALGFILWTFYSPAGDGVFPSVKTLQEITGASRQGVNKWMAALEREGFVRSEARFRKDGGQTTSIRVLTLPPETDVAGSPATDVAGGEATPVASEDTSKEETTKNKKTCVIDDVIEKQFAEFWAMYPKRKGPSPRKPARKSYEAAINRGAKHEVLMEGLAKLRKQHPVPTEFVPLATTWLNQDRWENEYDPTAETKPQGKLQW